MRTFQTTSDFNLDSHPLRGNLLALPKVELHRHLDCSMRWSTMKEISQTLNLGIPKEDAAAKRHLLVQSQMKDLDSVLKKFLIAQKLLASKEILTRLCFEAIEDAYLDGIRILELRYSPSFIQEGHPELSYEDIHQAFLKGREMAKHLKIAVGFICILQRTKSVKLADEIASFAIENKSTFLALDLADNEVGFESRPFRNSFLRAKDSGLNITVHAGEAPVPEAIQYIKDAVEILGATRIGHGLQIHKNEDAMAWAKSINLQFELCPISNWLTQAISEPTDHPIQKMMSKGLLCSICSDDPGIFGTTLTDDYVFLAKYQQMTELDFKKCNEVAFSASFIDPQLKQQVWF
jgi:adenosine deaminase